LSAGLNAVPQRPNGSTLEAGHRDGAALQIAGPPIDVMQYGPSTTRRVDGTGEPSRGIEGGRVDEGKKGRKGLFGGLEPAAVLLHICGERLGDKLARLDLPYLHLQDLDLLYYLPLQSR
jgi:hypothetical protein